MTVDIRDARFYVVDERTGSAQNQTEPLEFDTAIAQAERLVAYLSDLCTVPASLAGIPAISVPCGQSRSGMPKIGRAHV